MEVRSTYESDIEATELRLGLPGTDILSPPPLPETPRGNKRMLPETEVQPTNRPPSAKTQIVGWPPVRAFRKNSFQSKKTAAAAAQSEAAICGHFVKVSMDGAPYLRKVDMKLYKSYKDLKTALENMFKCFSLGEVSGMKGDDGLEYAITYEDKDGDLMLVGDVPFEMFINSCKRLRIMSGSEARGLSSS